MTVAERIEEMGCEDVVIFEHPSYESAFIGISHDNRAVYDFYKMVDYLVEKDNMTYDDAVEFIEYNTIGSIMGNGTYPIVIYTMEQ